MKLSTPVKISLFLLFLSGSVIGFMIRLPGVFRHSDKFWHSAYYFLAAAFLNLLFAEKKLLRHLLIFAGLYFFGIAIEHAQEYSNTYFHKTIHGRYDPEDVAANLKGLIAFSILWILLVAGWYIGKAGRGRDPEPPAA